MRRGSRATPPRRAPMPPPAPSGAAPAGAMHPAGAEFTRRRSWCPGHAFLNRSQASSHAARLAGSLRGERLAMKTSVNLSRSARLSSSRLSWRKHRGGLLVRHHAVVGPGDRELGLEFRTGDVLQEHPGRIEARRVRGDANRLVPRDPSFLRHQRLERQAVVEHAGLDPLPGDGEIVAAAGHGLDHLGGVADEADLGAKAHERRFELAELLAGQVVGGRVAVVLGDDTPCWEGTSRTGPPGPWPAPPRARCSSRRRPRSTCCGCT